MLTLFYKHKFVGKTEALQQNFQAVVTIAAKSLVKVGLPSMRNDPSCEYSKADFESDAEFNVQFMKVRAKALYLARLCAQIRPNFVFENARRWLLEILQGLNSAAAVLHGPNSATEVLRSPNSAADFELEAMPRYLDAVLLVVKQSEEFKVASLNALLSQKRHWIVLFF